MYPIHHSMLRRCYQWDYCAPAIYMITLTLEDRSQPLLGKVLPIFPPGVERSLVLPGQIQAEFHPSSLGEAVLEHWRQFSLHNPEIRPLYLQLMEEHLHGILQVMRQMKRPLGNAIGGFKTWCNKYYRTTTGSSTALFSDGFQDSILFQAGQLDRMFNYLRDNPRRLAIKRLYPNLFTTLHNLERDGGTYTAYGNSFLLDRSSFHLLQVSRSVTDAEMLKLRNAMFQSIAHGAPIVSACISPGEKMLMREAMEAGASLIALKNKGFPPIYKPTGKLFDACAEGRLLLLAPSDWGIGGEKKITREQCYVLNALASKIAGGLPQDIRYHGQTPENIDRLLRQAGFR